MIGKLKGILDSVAESSAILDVGGVGYVVSCSARTIGNFPMIGGGVALHIETVVREDAISLYGFASTEEHEAFRILCTVQGVGAKVALAILSGLSPQDIAKAIAFEDEKAFKGISGVGPKLAARLVTELKGKNIAGGNVADFAKIKGKGGVASLPKAPAAASMEMDAMSALVNLGYMRGDAARAVSVSINKIGEAAKLEQVITQALKELTP